MEGKSVALVGPASYVEHAGIETHVRNVDIVVRPNVKLWPTLDGLMLPKRTTSRCDVVYHSGSMVNETVIGPKAGKDEIISERAGLSPTALRMYAAHGVKRVILAVTQPNILKIRLRSQNFANLSRMFAGSQLNITFDYVRHLRRDQIFFSTGMRALLHIVRQRPRSLMLFGFDFYSDQAGKAFPGYYDAIPGVPMPLLGTSSMHHPSIAMRSLSNVMNTHSNVYIDSHLANVLWDTNKVRVSAAQTIHINKTAR